MGAQKFSFLIIAGVCEVHNRLTKGVIAPCNYLKSWIDKIAACDDMRRSLARLLPVGRETPWPAPVRCAALTDARAAYGTPENRDGPVSRGAWSAR
jgi:hypothetical protein